MQRGGGGRDDFLGFGSPFAGFGSFGGSGNMMSSFFGGRDPFDDPFFTQPFGSMTASGMLGRSMFGQSMLGPSMFGPSMMGPSMFNSDRRAFGEPRDGFIQSAPPTRSSGPIIEEITSDDEGEGGDMPDTEQKDNPRKHPRSGKEPDEETEAVEAVKYAEKKSKHMQGGSSSIMSNIASPQTRAYSFHSSTVTYGGVNGAYYTSSTTRKTGGNGVTVEESKEADTTTGRATHRVSRAIREKGHSVTRKLDDGRVETMQTLHNLEEEELPQFEESWKGSAREHLPGWNQNMDILGNGINSDVPIFQMTNLNLKSWVSLFDSRHDALDYFLIFDAPESYDLKNPEETAPTRGQMKQQVEVDGHFLRLSSSSSLPDMEQEGVGGYKFSDSSM